MKALNKIRRPSTAAEMADLLNRELREGDKPFHATEIAGAVRVNGARPHTEIVLVEIASSKVRFSAHLRRVLENVPELLSKPKPILAAASNYRIAQAQPV
jgi:hypothetical protein